MFIKNQQICLSLCLSINAQARLTIYIYIICIQKIRKGNFVGQTPITASNTSDLKACTNESLQATLNMDSRDCESRVNDYNTFGRASAIF